MNRIFITRSLVYYENHNFTKKKNKIKIIFFFEKIDRLNEYLSFQKKEKKKSLLFEFQEIQLIFEECRLQHPATKERKEKQHSFEEIRWYFELTLGFLFGGFPHT